MWNYSEKVKDHFFAPRNAKAVEDANATGDVGSLSCGDALRLTLKVNEETEIIEDAGFQTFGCGSAIASSSALTEMIIGKTISEAQNLTNQQIADYLDGLPPEKMHCSVMGMEALHAAIANYRGEEVAEDHEEGELICRCYAIDSELIKRVVLQNNLSSLGDVIRYTKAGGACGACHEKIEWALEDILKAQGKSLGSVPARLPLPEPETEPAEATPIAAKAKLTTVQRIKKIEAVLDEVRPGIQADGGDIQLNDVEDDMVFVALTGACTGCGLAGATLSMVEERIAEALGENITVYPVAGSSADGRCSMSELKCYLDNNATTQIDPAVVETMMPFLTEHYGNPSSIHSFGQPVGKALAKAREQVQKFIGAEHSSEIIFTSCATEATATAILSTIECYPEKKEIITSVVEHPATLELCRTLERKGYKIHWIGVDKQGRLDIDAYKQALSKNVAIISIMWANNETGTLFPIQKLAMLAKQAGIPFHCDAVQVAGKMPINVEFIDVDMLSISGHKFHAPKGVGALYLRRGSKFKPMIRGGHQERGRRAGTENVCGIIAMGKACELAAQSIYEDTARIELMRSRLEQGLRARIPNSFVTGDVKNRVPNTTNVAFEFVEGEAILLMLNQEGIAASSGSACTSGALEPSHVMKAMDIPYTAAHGAIRFSLSRFTTEDMIDHVLDKLPPIIERLRLMSPYWDAENNAAKDFIPMFG